MAGAAAVVGTVDGDADALMTCKQTTSGTGILTPDQNICAVTVQRQPALQETGEQNSLCVPVSGVSWRPLANVSQADCMRRAIQTCYLSASTVLAVASASAAVGAGNNVGRCVDTGSVGQ